MRRLPITTIDFETYYVPKGIKGHPDAGYSVRSMMTQEYVCDARFKAFGASIKEYHCPTVWVEGHNLDYYFRRMAEVSPWDQRAVLGHNLRFDGLILSHHYGVVPGQYIDTLGMARAVFGALLPRHGLDVVAKVLGRTGKVEGGKALEDIAGVRDLSPEQAHRLGIYAVGDADDTEFLYDTMLPAFPVSEFEMLDSVTRMAADPILRLDIDTIRELIVEAEAERKEIIERGLRWIPGMTMTQLGQKETFAKVWQYATGKEPPKKYSKKTGKQGYAFASDDQAFFEQAVDGGRMAADLRAAKLAKGSNLKVTRLKRFERLHATGAPFAVPLNYSGALNSHRLSGADSLNMQNLPQTQEDEVGDPVPGLRHVIIAGPGRQLVVVDSAGIEFLICMTLAGQTDVLDRREAGDDEYALFGGEIIGEPITKKTHPVERQIGKVGVLQLQYQSGGKGFRKSLFAQTDGKTILSIAEANKVVATYRGRYKGVTALWRALQGVLDQMAAGVPNPTINVEQRFPVTFHSDGFTLPSGLKVKYPDLRMTKQTFVDEETGVKSQRTQLTYKDVRKTGSRAGLYPGKLLENICQALASEVVDEQLMEIARTYPRLVLNVHDEGVFSVLNDEADACYALAQQVMSKPPLWWPELRVGSSGDYSPIYGVAK